MRFLLLLACLSLPTASLSEVRVPASTQEISLSFAPVVRAAAPAVVNIYAKRIVQRRSSPFANDPFFGGIFNQNRQLQPRVENSLGSGVIVTEDGLVVSNFHVVGGATDIRVVLKDRREIAAEVVLADEESDLAILQLDVEQVRDLTVLPLRDAETIEVGDLVLAIGNPFGVGQTVSSGIISGLARSGARLGNARGYFIQTDAAINPGNSGGALVDSAGRLVGINTSILTRSGGSNGIGFAIPANLVAQFIAQAREGNDRFLRPWAGVSAQSVDDDVAQSLGMGRPEGIILTELHPQSPLRAAGLRRGDVILSVDGLPVATPPEMIYRMSVTGIGNRVRLEVLRNETRTARDIDLMAAPNEPAPQIIAITQGPMREGLVVSNINPSVEQRLGLALPHSGVVVLRADGNAARIGLRIGDILEQINGISIEKTSDVVVAIEQINRVIEIDLVRNGRGMRLRFRI